MFFCSYWFFTMAFAACILVPLIGKERCIRHPHWVQFGSIFCSISPWVSLWFFLDR
jgi:hypothetical protein